MVKQDVDEAKVHILKSVKLWLPKYKEVDEGKAAAGTFDPVEVCPLSYTTRLNTARILIEVEDYENAVEVLEGLLEENNEVRLRYETGDSVLLSIKMCDEDLG